jgi:hypothetical protein
MGYKQKFQKELDSRIDQQSLNSQLQADAYSTIDGRSEDLFNASKWKSGNSPGLAVNKLSLNNTNLMLMIRYTLTS